MQKFSKRDFVRRDEIKSDLETKHSDMREAWATLSNAVNIYNNYVAAFNEVLDDARGFAADCDSAIDDFMSDKSEKWQEGERGEAFCEWKSEFENVDFTDIVAIDISEFEPGEEIDAVDTLVNLPEEPSA